MTFNAQKFVDLINNTKNPKMQSRMMKEFILNYAPDYFNENSVNYSKEDYLETFLPKKLTDEDFKHLQELGQRMNPPVHITDNEENRKSILDEKRANLKATLEEWFDYLNDEDGGLVYLNDDARHWILNSVVNLESRVLDDKPKLKTLETLLDKPHEIDSYIEIDPNSFDKFKEIIDKYEARDINKLQVKQILIKETGRDPDLDYDFKEKLTSLFSNDQINKVNLYSLILNDPRGTKVNFQKRSENSIKDFPILNSAAVAEISDVLHHCRRQALFYEIENIKQVISDEYKDDPKLTKFLKRNIQIDNNKNTSIKFAPIYAFFQNRTYQDIDLSITDGKWRKFPKGSDPSELRNSVKSFNTGWCIQGLDTAGKYLEEGDIYIYFSHLSEDEMRNEDKDPTVPRLAMVEINDEITEIRGIASSQNLDFFIVNTVDENGSNILENKLRSLDENDQPLFKNADTWLEADNDNKYIGVLYSKFKNNEEFNKNELFSLYQIGKSIKFFGRFMDDRVQEILNARDTKEDLTKIFGSDMSDDILYANEYMVDSYSMLLINLFRDQKVERNKIILNTLKENLSTDDYIKCLTDKNRKNNGNTPILCAARSCNFELFISVFNELEQTLPKERLLDILENDKDKDGNNLLMRVAMMQPNFDKSKKGKEEIVNFLAKTLKHHDLLSQTVLVANKEGKTALGLEADAGRV